MVPQTRTFSLPLLGRRPWSPLTRASAFRANRPIVAALLLLAAPAAAANYTEVIPAMGPGFLPGPAALGAQPDIVRAQIVDKSGPIDFVFKEYGQNWLCLGDDGDPDNPDNYPVVGVFDAGPLPQGFADPGVPAGAIELARISMPMAKDMAACAASDSCYTLHAYLKPVAGPWVSSGDVLIWAVLRRGSNCPGTWWFNYGGNPPYPGAPGGEITLGIHVREPT